MDSEFPACYRRRKKVLEGEDQEGGIASRCHTGFSLWIDEKTRTRRMRLMCWRRWEEQDTRRKAGGQGWTLVSWIYSTNYFAALLFSRSVVSDFANPWTAACQASLFITISQRLLNLMSIESVMPLNHLIFCHWFLLPSIFPSITVFPNESALCIRRPNYWSFSISLSNEYSGLIFFRID